MRARRFLAWALLWGLLAAGCGGGTTPGGSATTSPPAPTTSASPAPFVPNHQGEPTEMYNGTALVTTPQGDVFMRLVAAFYYPGSQTIEANWSEEGNTFRHFNLEGRTVVGTFPSSSEFMVDFNIEPRFTSTGGECTVTLARAGENGIEGSVSCGALGYSANFNSTL